MITIVDILNTLSDDKAFVLFNTIALCKGRDIKVSLNNMGITPRQYYSRLLKLTRAGLVKRENGRYMTTTLGNVVYEAVSMMGKALNHYWVLKAIESFRASSEGNSGEHMSRLIDTLIDDHQIKKILANTPLVPMS